MENFDGGGGKSPGRSKRPAGWQRSAVVILFEGLDDILQDDEKSFDLAALAVKFNHVPDIEFSLKRSYRSTEKYTANLFSLVVDF